MQEEIDKLKKELDNQKKVLGTLIAWLTTTLGDHAVKELLDTLHSLPE